jgi:hypothetical protein
LAESSLDSYFVPILKLISHAVEGTNVPGDDLLFDKEFLEESVEKAFVQPRNFDARCTKFRVKHLNIIDPLKECNNLGRSVNRGLNQPKYVNRLSLSHLSSETCRKIYCLPEAS